MTGRMFAGLGLAPASASALWRPPSQGRSSGDWFAFCGLPLAASTRWNTCGTVQRLESFKWFAYCGMAVTHVSTVLREWVEWFEVKILEFLESPSVKTQLAFFQSTQSMRKQEWHQLMVQIVQGPQSYCSASPIFILVLAGARPLHPIYINVCIWLGIILIFNRELTIVIIYTITLLYLQLYNGREYKEKHKITVVKFSR